MSGEHAIIRPVRESDLDAVLELTRSGGTGLTNFPRDRDTLKRRLGCAVQSLEVVTYLGEKPGGTPALIATGHAPDFRLVRGGVSSDYEGIWMDPGSAKSLRVSGGELLQVFPVEARAQ